MLKKIILNVFIASCLLLPPLLSFAVPSFEYNSGTSTNVIANTTKLGNQSPVTIVLYLLNWGLGLLGLLFLLLTLYGGYKWMNARGNEDGIDTAKKTITAAVIGLVITLASYGISAYLYNRISDISR